MTSTSIDRFTGLASGLAYKTPCRAATTANITLSGTQTIDGIAVVADDRVLVKNQTTQTQNGIYNVSATAWTRALDFDGVRDVVNGTQVLVTAGTAAAGVQYQLTTANPITIGTSNLTFSALAISGANANLTALGALNSAAGYLAQTAAATFTKRTLTGTANQVVITNGDGTTGNPVFSLPQSIDTAASVQFTNIALNNNGTIKTVAGAGSTFKLNAYNTGSSAYQTFATFTANNPPTCAFAGTTITGGTINSAVIGGSSPAAGTFTLATAASFAPTGTSVPAVGMYTTTGVDVAFASNGVISARILSTGSETDNLVFKPGGGGNPVEIDAEGTSADISIYYNTKGTESHVFAIGGTPQAAVINTASAKNSLTFSGGSSAGGVATIGILGGGSGSTNCDIAIVPKGTGVLKYGSVTASSDVAVTGYVTIKGSTGATIKLAVIA